MSETGASARVRLPAALRRLWARLYVLAIDIELHGLDGWETAVKLDNALEEPQMAGIRMRRQRLLVQRVVLLRMARR